MYVLCVEIAQTFGMNKLNQREFAYRIPKTTEY